MTSTDLGLDECLVAMARQSGEGFAPERGLARRTPDDLISEAVAA